LLQSSKQPPAVLDHPAPPFARNSLETRWQNRQNPRPYFGFAGRRLGAKAMMIFWIRSHFL
jgi:hypothetical protein